MNIEHQILLDKIVEQLKSELKPERIFLFGSYIWGFPNKDSDFDLFVIADDSKESNLKRTRRAYRSLRELSGIVPIDILIRSKSEIAPYINDSGSLFHRIINNGLLLYETT